MKTFLTLALVLVVFVTVAESAQRCYSGSKDRYESRQCDTGTAGNFVCQKFTCEGGKSPFVLRTCANKRTGCLAGPAICKFSKGTGIDSNFTVRACAPEGSRCESSSTVCADQDGVGYCSICEDDNCNSADSLFGKMALSMGFVMLARIF
ncbi:hypothetical protein GCK72_022025 [Caenorhabditis remanei]|uniref:DUF281 domain-containing protein n=1 Tax=Caenorhabditis remanei TaxID=31234 RepID=A0A6A5GLE5_CAERE|nr:hypothetical protein GCK72_022025 [Caenorhabditis remanei]KAF1755456.1 hypothetical protein GCK72_022025 [Caenorhabditis remanei]